MPRPRDCEFTRETVVEGLKRSGFCCERCGISKYEAQDGYLEMHHILGICKAVTLYPEISHLLISSIANLRVLCKPCHQIEDNEMAARHAEWAERLKNMDHAKFLLTQRRPKRIA